MNHIDNTCNDLKHDNHSNDRNNKFWFNTIVLIQLSGVDNSTSSLKQKYPDRSNVVSWHLEIRVFHSSIWSPIDFPAKLNIGDFISATIVQKSQRYYFFYGNVATYSKKEGQGMKDFIWK